jgi:phosphoenolpyruvate-protein kinase (PTS system EI component)
MKSETIPELRSRLKSASPEEAERIAEQIIEIRKRESVREERKKK